jgi:hypothetical protein
MNNTISNYWTSSEREQEIYEMGNVENWTEEEIADYDERVTKAMFEIDYAAIIARHQNDKK